MYQPVHCDNSLVTPVTGNAGTDIPASVPVPGTRSHPAYRVHRVRLNQSELRVLNSPVTPIQLEHIVHESLGNIPSVQDEHSSEHSQAFQGLLNSYSPDDSADEFPERSPLRHSGHQSLGICHTGNPSDHEHSVHRSQSVRPDAVDHW